jgi:hypothetical protein
MPSSVLPTTSALPLEISVKAAFTPSVNCA